MKVRALILDAARELLYRKTLLFYFGLVTLVHLFLILALQTDVADGAITSLKVFGLEGHASGSGFTLDNRGVEASPGLTAEALVQGLQFGISFVLYPMGILLAVFATASLVPRMLEKGTIDLILAKPVSRPMLFLARYLGALLVAGVNLLYLVGGVGLILGLKTGVWNWAFILSGLMMTAYFGALLGFLVLIGVLLRSTSISLMMTTGIFIVSLVIRLPHSNRNWPMLFTSKTARFLAQSVVESLFHGLPRTYDVGQIASALIMHKPVVTWMPMAATLGSGLVALGLAILYFRRVDF
jgi:ABC-type transport system involved in multi-copper enzyme maturation permease subunit